MRTYKPPTNQYTVEGPIIRVAPGSEIHKVSGTSMAGILGVSPWSTPFQVACNLLGLGQEDISDKPAVKVGIALESKIIKYADKAYPQYGMFAPAEDAFVKREGDHNAWVSDFEDDYFAGHVDGIVSSDDGVDRILEIKTSSNLESWEFGVPRYYYLQVALYNHFITKQDTAYVVLGVVNENTYKDYNSWIPNENTVRLFELDMEQDEFETTLADVREWYDKYIMNGMTPPYDPENQGDVELYNHLVNLASDYESMQPLVDEYKDLCDEIDNAEAAIKDKYDAREDLKNRLKTYMEAHDLSQIPSKEKEGLRAVMGTQNRASWDEAAMVADGIDTNKYKKSKVIKTFSIKE